jgi:alkanesulfonate monooxygenase SsuD/methylene tetrahydromethanopterin reductase-like flavin-dependent oxidoreductase (luciferase family)
MPGGGVDRSDAPLDRPLPETTLPNVASINRRRGRVDIFSDGGRALAARHADVVFSANSEHRKAVAYAADLRGRLARYGRSVDSLRILPGASVVLGDTPQEAKQHAEWVRRERITRPRALAFFEQ